MKKEKNLLITKENIVKTITDFKLEEYININKVENGDENIIKTKLPLIIKNNNIIIDKKYEYKDISVKEKLIDLIINLFNSILTKEQEGEENKFNSSIKLYNLWSSKELTKKDLNDICNVYYINSIYNDIKETKENPLSSLFGFMPNKKSIVKYNKVKNNITNVLYVLFDYHITRNIKSKNKNKLIESIKRPLNIKNKEFMDFHDNSFYNSCHTDVGALHKMLAYCLTDFNCKNSIIRYENIDEKIKDQIDDEDISRAFSYLRTELEFIDNKNDDLLCEFILKIAEVYKGKIDIESYVKNAKYHEELGLINRLNAEFEKKRLKEVLKESIDNTKTTKKIIKL